MLTLVFADERMFMTILSVTALLVLVPWVDNVEIRYISFHPPSVVKPHEEAGVDSETVLWVVLFLQQRRV